MIRVISTEDLRGLFTKPYGMEAPTKKKWAQFYNENVIFIEASIFPGNIQCIAGAATSPIYATL